MKNGWVTLCSCLCATKEEYNTFLYITNPTWPIHKIHTPLPIIPRFPSKPPQADRCTSEILDFKGALVDDVKLKIQLESEPMTT